MKKYSKHDNMNSDSDKKVPKSPMGQMFFGNLPDKAMIKAFPKSHDYRGGILNNPACDLDLLSRVDEME